MSHHPRCLKDLMEEDILCGEERRTRGGRQFLEQVLYWRPHFLCATASEDDRSSVVTRVIQSSGTFLHKTRNECITNATWVVLDEQSVREKIRRAFLATIGASKGILYKQGAVRQGVSGKLAAHGDKDAVAKQRDIPAKPGPCMEVSRSSAEADADLSPEICATAAADPAEVDRRMGGNGEVERRTKTKNASIVCKSLGAQLPPKSGSKTVKRDDIDCSSILVGHESETKGGISFLKTIRLLRPLFLVAKTHQEREGVVTSILAFSRSFYVPSTICHGLWEKIDRPSTRAMVRSHLAGTGIHDSMRPDNAYMPSFAIAPMIAKASAKSVHFSEICDGSILCGREDRTTGGDAYRGLVERLRPLFLAETTTSAERQDIVSLVVQACGTFYMKWPISSDDMWVEVDPPSIRARIVQALSEKSIESLLGTGSESALPTDDCNDSPGCPSPEDEIRATKVSILADEGRKLAPQGEACTAQREEAENRQNHKCDNGTTPDDELRSAEVSIFADEGRKLAPQEANTTQHAEADNRKKRKFDHVTATGASLICPVSTLIHDGSGRPSVAAMAIGQKDHYNDLDGEGEAEMYSWPCREKNCRYWVKISQYAVEGEEMPLLRFGSAPQEQPLHNGMMVDDQVPWSESLQRRLYSVIKARRFHYTKDHPTILKIAWPTAIRREKLEADSKRR
jgi:hypothetical protein